MLDKQCAPSILNFHAAPAGLWAVSSLAGLFNGRPDWLKMMHEARLPRPERPSDAPMTGRGPADRGMADRGAAPRAPLLRRA